jgi:hypothetical protein
MVGAAVLFVGVAAAVAQTTAPAKPAGLAVANEPTPRPPSPVHPASFPLAVKPGQTVSLEGDVILTGEAVFDIQGTAEQPCVIVGNGYQVKTKGQWTGRLKAAYCTFKQLGRPQAVIKIENPGNWSGFKIEDPDAPAFEMTATGNGDITFEHCRFDDSSFLTFATEGNSTLTFRGNTILENGRFPVSEQPATSRAAFSLVGSSPARKLFQGNRIYKGECRFRSANVLIGGDRDEDSNLVIGIRAKIQAAGTGTIIRGNYVHVLLLGREVPPHFEYWSQVSTFEPGAGTLAEHNVIRDGEWIIRFVEGDFRYNLICDINDHDLCQNGCLGKIHHNIFFASQPKHAQGSMGGCISVIYKPKTPDGGIEIYNNTFDGCGWLAVPAVEVGKDALVKTLRNNVFFNFALQEKYGKAPAAMVRAGFFEEAPSSLPARIGYADCNLFYNPKSKSKVNYALGVAGKTLRKDAGFALDDIRKGGPVDEQVDPRFAGPLPTAFPYEDDDIKSGKVTVSQMLADFRKAYTPAADSPLIDSADPADGEGADVGAVGAGKAHKDDGFGRWGDGSKAGRPDAGRREP